MLEYFIFSGINTKRQMRKHAAVSNHIEGLARMTDFTIPSSETLSRKEYMRQWRQKNKIRLDAYNKAYRLEHPNMKKDADKRYAEAHPEKIRERTNRWRSANRDRRNKTECLANEKSPQKARARRKKWREKNSELISAYARNRRARKKNVEGHHTKSDVLLILKKQKYRCVYCSINIADNYHVDHIVALANGGSNWPKNLQCLCPLCNVKKKDKDHLVFARQMGKLL